MRFILFSCWVFLFLQDLTGQEASLNVMTFNIRYPSPDDGINYWDNRRPLVASTIRFHEADLIGVQEAHRRQLDELVSDMPEYDWFGVCRVDGTLRPDPDGEFSAILFRKARFERTDGGTFWLSETPEVAGSKSWDTAFPRIVTWAKFHDRETGESFFYFNTHFDHVGILAREESAKLLLSKMKTIAGDSPVILSGDFNSIETDTPYRLMTGDNSTFRMTDAMYASASPHHGPSGSFSGTFLLPGVGDNRIDYIFIRNGIAVLKHAILSDSWDGRLPSDHLPVFAEVRVE